MTTSVFTHPAHLATAKSLTIALTTSVALFASILQPSFAGRIVSATSVPYAPNAPGFVAQGFGGWNLDNVSVLLTGTESVFDESNGSYFFDIDSDLTYQASVTDGTETFLGIVLAKPWPIGEPSGIKVVNDDLAVKEPKPTNCIMATSYLEDHYLDSTDPQQVICSGPFQSHKRYKLAMLPTTVSDGQGAEQGIDLVFNVEEESGSRDYQIFQKINNWTNGRLEGFTIQVGTGVGDSFVAAADIAGVGVDNLSLSVPETIWTVDQLAVFSEGLFGPPDLKHDRPAGFFDPDTRAGFVIQEYPNQSGETDTLRSGARLGSDYADVPAGGASDNQFGTWLPNTMLPHGIFWDDDGNPETDAVLIAWYGYNPAANGYGWMGGADTNFSAVPDATILEWGANLEYSEDLIDDLVNVGLNYVVTVGDVSGFPTNTDGTYGVFTLRITPIVDTSGTGTPGYTTMTPTPTLVFASSDAVVTLSPSPEFVIGEVLTARVGDADLNGDPSVVDEVSVTLTSSDGYTDTLVLEELGADRGVFAAILPEKYSDTEVGTVVTLTYTDADRGDGISVEKSASTTAASEPPPPPPVPDVLIDEFSVPENLFVNQTSLVRVSVQNAKEAETAVSGEVVVSANGVVLLREAFVDLDPNRKFKTSMRWTATEEGGVLWTASVIVNEASVASATATTEVTVKPGKNLNYGNK